MTQIYSFMVIEVRSLKAPCPCETCREGTFLTSLPALVIPTMLSIIWLEATALQSLFLSSYDLCGCVCVCVCECFYILSPLYSPFYKDTQGFLGESVAGIRLTMQEM